MKAPLSTVALLAFASAVAAAQVQVDKSKTLRDFTGTWDGFNCLVSSKQGAPNTSVDGGILTVEYVNGPEFETQMKETFKLAFHAGKSTETISGDMAVTYLDSGETHGGSTAVAMRSDPNQSLTDFANEYADKCAHPND